MFKVLRSDADLLVISNKYLDELRALPDEKLSAIASLVEVGKPPCSSPTIADQNRLLYRLRWVNIPA